MEDCIFCKIIDKKVNSEIVYEDEFCIAFKDVNPRSRVHILIVTRKHIPTIADLTDSDEKLMGHLVNIAKQLAEKYECDGYQLLFNVGKNGGQLVFHVHLHLMGN